MARKIRDTHLETREARKRLGSRPEPHWRVLDQGLHLGYRRRANGGSWTARRRNGDGRYVEVKLGAADDGNLDADGLAVLSYWQAQDQARRWFHEAVRIDAGLEPVAAGPCTVAEAMCDYLAHYEARGGRGLAATRAAAEAHILPALGAVTIAALSTKRIRDWHHALAAEAPRVRSRKGKAPRRRAVARDHESRRRRQATANRVLTVLKSALNHAWREGKAASDDAWRRVRPFHDVDAPVVRYLTEAECGRLVNATDAGFRPMVRAALLSGCRYGELAALRVADFNPDAGTLAIRATKSGKARHVVLTEEGRRFFADTTAGRDGAASMFHRPGGESWGKSHQQRPLFDACKRAKIAPAVSFHVLRHTHGSLLAMKGVPMPVIAQQLGHADTRMTEKHYAHLSPSYVAETIRASFPKLGIVETGKVAALSPRAR